MKSKITKQKKYLFRINAKKIARADELVIYIVMPILALVSFVVRAKILPNFLYYDKFNRLSVVNLYTHAKVLLLGILTGALLCYILYRLFAYEIYPQLDYITIGLGIIVIMAIVATILSPVKENPWWGSYEKGNGLLAYLGIYLLTYTISQLYISKKTIKYICIIVNLVIIIMCLFGISQFFGYNIAETEIFAKLVTPKGINLTFSTVKSPFVGTKYFKVESMLQNLNYFGAFCIIYFPFITTIALKERKIRLKAYYYLGVIVSVLGLAIAQAFTAILTLFVIVPLLVITVVNRRNIIEFIVISIVNAYIIFKINEMTLGQALAEVFDLLQKIVTHQYGKALIIVSLIALVGFLVIKPFVYKHYSTIIKCSIILFIIIGAIGFTIFLKVVVPDNKDLFSKRGYIWHYTQDVIEKNPLVGVGPDKYYYEFPQDIEGEKYQMGVVVDRPHNMYLQYITDIGFIGLIGFFIIIIGTIWRTADKLQHSEEEETKVFITAISILLVSYLIQGLANDNMVAIQLMLWPLIGITMSLTSNKVTEEIAEKLEL